MFITLQIVQRVVIYNQLVTTQNNGFTKKTYLLLHQLLLVGGNWAKVLVVSVSQMGSATYWAT
jgi:hypothetical protein